MVHLSLSELVSFEHQKWKQGNDRRIIKPAAQRHIHNKQPHYLLKPIWFWSEEKLNYNLCSVQFSQSFFYLTNPSLKEIPFWRSTHLLHNLHIFRSHYVTIEIHTRSLRIPWRSSLKANETILHNFYSSFEVYFCVVLSLLSPTRKATSFMSALTLVIWRNDNSYK